MFDHLRRFLHYLFWGFRTPPMVGKSRMANRIAAMNTTDRMLKPMPIKYLTP